MPRTKGARAVTRREDDIIRLLRARGDTYASIAERTGLAKPTVHARVRKMEAAGTINDLPFDFLAACIEARNE